MTTSATKFTFDTVFDDHEDIVADAARGRRRRSLSEAEIETLCEAARQEGRHAGEVAAQEAIAAAARDTGKIVETAIARLSQERRSVLEQSAQLAFAVARKLAHSALEAFPAADVEAALRDAMHQAIGEPRIVLKAAPAVAEALGARINDIAHEEAFEGRVQLSADPSLKRADCRIEWRGGGAERAEAAIEDAIEKLISRQFGDGATDAEGADHGR